MRFCQIAVLSLLFAAMLQGGEVSLGSHKAVRGPSGLLLPWEEPDVILKKELAWYASCPEENGYPRFFSATFLDGRWETYGGRSDTIPATQNSLAILSYLAAHRRYDGTGRQFLDTAVRLGEFLLWETLTPDHGAYPRFPHSTGRRGVLPLPPDCGSQDDQPFEIQPDKGALVAVAWWRLHLETGRTDFRDAALHVAQVLVSNMREADEKHSPWPFRADWRTGEARGGVSGNLSPMLRLFDDVLAAGHSEFSAPRGRLWSWISRIQIPNADADGRLWAQFFEDHHNPENRTAWAPLNLARYLLERRERLSPTWKEDSKRLIEFVNRTFVRVRFGIAVCGEQDEDLEPWGGVLSTYAAVLTLYGRQTGERDYETVADQAFVACLYATDTDGCPRDNLLHLERGGWQEDAHTDKIHNLVQVLECREGR